MRGAGDRCAEELTCGRRWRSTAGGPFGRVLAGATGLTKANLDLAGTPGTGIGDGAIDTLVLNGSDGEDHVQLTTIGTNVLASGLTPTVETTASETTDVLDVNTLGGKDKITVDPAVEQVITPVLDLGPDQ